MHILHPWCTTIRRIVVFPRQASNFARRAIKYHSNIKITFVSSYCIVCCYSRFLSLPPSVRREVEGISELLLFGFPTSWNYFKLTLMKMSLWEPVFRGRVLAVNVAWHSPQYFLGLGGCLDPAPPQTFGAGGACAHIAWAGEETN